jgi:hypothetical protein
LLQAAPKECYEATVPSDVPDDIKAECGDLEVLYNITKMESLI